MTDLKAAIQRAKELATATRNAIKNCASPTVAAIYTQRAEDFSALISATESAERLAEALADFIDNPQFVVTMGGNPIVVQRSLEFAHTALAEYRGEE